MINELPFITAVYMTKFFVENFTQMTAEFSRRFSQKQDY